VPPARRTHPASHAVFWLPAYRCDLDGGVYFRCAQDNHIEDRSPGARIADSAAVSDGSRHLTAGAVLERRSRSLCLRRLRTSRACARFHLEMILRRGTPTDRKGRSYGRTGPGLFYPRWPNLKLTDVRTIGKIMAKGQTQAPTCSNCGAYLILALPPGGEGPPTFHCFD
jgi:hypothetical protein